jgi:hypothetical protein
MDARSKVSITDKDGWLKEFPLQKPLIHVGSDPRNDIVLEVARGEGVVPRHLQLIAMPGRGYRAINLNEADVLLGEAGDRVLLPHSVIDIADGECVRLGQYRLVFHLNAEPVALNPQQPSPVMPATSAGPGLVAPRIDVPPVTSGRPAPSAPVAAAVEAEKASATIGLKLSLPQAVLDPACPLEGAVTVRNLGKEPGVQFKLGVEGLDSDCYEIGPGPILFPGVEKGVYLRLYHPRRPGLAAGRHEICVNATAPDAYPGESVTVCREIEVLPYFKHSLSLTPVD